jgi:hypothetical protein
MVVTGNYLFDGSFPAKTHVWRRIGFQIPENR